MALQNSLSRREQVMYLWKMYLYIWSAGPRRPSEESNAIYGWLPFYVTDWLAIWLSGYISMSRRRVPTSFSQCLVSPCNCLVQKINQGTDVLTHNWLPRLIILTSNHKIKIDMASWQSAFTPSTANAFFYHFRKC